MIFASLIGEHPSTGAYRAADQGAFTATQKASYYRAAYGRTTHHFGRGVMLMIARVLRLHSMPMPALSISLLSPRGERNGNNRT